MESESAWGSAQAPAAGVGEDEGLNIRAGVGCASPQETNASISAGEWDGERYDAGKHMLLLPRLIERHQGDDVVRLRFAVVVPISVAHYRVRRVDWVSVEIGHCGVSDAKGVSNLVHDGLVQSRAAARKVYDSSKLLHDWHLLAPNHLLLDRPQDYPSLPTANMPGGAKALGERGARQLNHAARKELHLETAYSRNRTGGTFLTRGQGIVGRQR